MIIVDNSLKKRSDCNHNLVTVPGEQQLVPSCDWSMTHSASPCCSGMTHTIPRSCGTSTIRKEVIINIVKL